MKITPLRVFLWVAMLFFAFMIYLFIDGAMRAGAI